MAGIGDPPGQLQALLECLDRAVGVPGALVRNPDVLQRQAELAVVAELTRDRGRLFVAGDRGLVVAARTSRASPGWSRRRRSAGRCSSARASSSARLEVRAGGLEVALLGGQDAGAVLDVHPQLRWAVARRQRRLGELAALGDVAAGAPVVRGAPDQRQRRLDVAGGGRVADRGADVVVIGVEPRAASAAGRRCACPPRPP